MIGNRLGLGVAAGFVLAAVVPAGSGCGSDPQGAGLTLLTPMPDQVLTLKDDTDEERDGLQFEVTGSSHGISQGTTIRLFIDGEERNQVAKVDDEGKIDFGDVTLPPGEHDIHIETSTGSSSSDKEQQYTFKALLIRSPEDGSQLSSKEDEDPDEPNVQIGVRIEAFAIDSDEVSLLLDGDEVDTLEADSAGIALFEGVTLIDGRHELVARSGSGEDRIESPAINVNVAEASCAGATFLSPKPPSKGDSITLGGRNACGEDGSLTIDVQLSTSAGNGRPASLKVNGQPAGTTTVADAQITFEDVALTNTGSEANEISVEFENSDGAPCTVDFPVEVFVDCEAPRCNITSPTPLEYVGDASDETISFLNAAMQNGNGFDLTVETDAQLEGSDVQLVIDGRTTAPLTAEASKDGDVAVAAFDQIALEDGEHTIEALCVDAAGNVGSSGELSWVVDTSPCGLAITDPAVAARFVPGDDEDGASAGTQVFVTSAVVGDDCVAQRSGVCDAAGTIGGDFAAYDGSSTLMTSVRLADDAVDQSLCVEVQDRAGNTVLDNVAVTFVHTAPLVQIESPSDGDAYNILGDAGFSADANPGTPAVCDAEFSVACTLGSQVELRLDSANGTVIGSGDCAAPASGDPALPSGYDGRAIITAPFDDGDGTGVVVATQTIAGTSTQTLVGASTAITLSGDCVKPVPTLIGDPCNAANDSLLVVQQLTDTVTKDVTANTVENDLTNLSLVIANTDGTSSSTDSLDGIAPGNHVWPDQLLGGIGTVTITASARDSSANVGQAQCTAQITSDPPSVTLTAPANDAELGPRAAYGETCDTGVAGEYGVLVTGNVDKAQDRTVAIYVNGDLVDDSVPLTGTAFSACVAVPDDAVNDPDGASTVTARVATTLLGNAYVESSRSVHVHTVEITDPTDGQNLTASADCIAGTGFGYTVHADVDISHLNKAYTLSSGFGADAQGAVTGPSVSGCVPVDAGDQTITATIAGSPAFDEVGVHVFSSATVSILSPLDGAQFGPRSVVTDSCDAGAGKYGIPLTAMIDMMAEREVDILVNGADVPSLSDLVPTAAGEVSACVPVTDDADNPGGAPTTITVRATSTQGGGSSSADVDVTVTTIAITDPLPGAALPGNADCLAGAGYGYLVQANIDPAYSGRTYTLTAGSGDVTGTVTGSIVSGCVALTNGASTIEATVSGSAAIDAVNVTAFELPGITLTSPTDGQQFGPRANVADTCDAGAGKYGVPVSATIDQAPNRQVQFLVNGTAFTGTVSLVGTTATACLGVPDNADHGAAASTITARVTNTLSSETASDSADVNVNTLAITDPVETATVGTNCATSGFGYQTVIAVDPSHAGATYTLFGGVGSAAAGTVGSSGAATGCVPLNLGPGTITASLSGSSVTATAHVTVAVTDMPSVTLTSPANLQGFGPRASVAATCDTGTAGEYGVRVTATIDSNINRQVEVLVNGTVEAADVTIGTGNVITACVPVPDNLAHTPSGTSTIQVRATSTLTSAATSASVAVSVDTLVITAPTANQVLSSANNCAGAGFGATVTITADVSRNGSSVSFASGAHTAMGIPIAGGTASACLTLDGGAQMITATLAGGQVTDTVNVTVNPGLTATIALTATCPSTGSATYRTDPVALSWTLAEDYPGQWASYQLRCSTKTVASSTTPAVWWSTDSSPVTFAVTPPAVTGGISYRPEETRYCVLRAADGSGQLSQISAGTAVKCAFRQQVLAAAGANEGGTTSVQLGQRVSAVGDVDGDGFEDILVGGRGRAELIFGAASGLSSPHKVVFTTNSTFGGRTVSGIGDFNGDSLPDFAIADVAFDGNRGRVSIFFGRPQASWPATNIVLDATACAADLCLDHTGIGAATNITLAPAGDFNGDGAPDLVAAWPAYPTGSFVGRVLIVEGGTYERRTCTGAADCRATETCVMGPVQQECELAAGQTFWGLEFEVPSGNWANPPSGPAVARMNGFVLDSDASATFLGNAAASLGSFDTHSGAELAISATGAGKIFTLSGRSHSATTGFDALTVADLGLRDPVTDLPSGLPISTGVSSVSYGAWLAPIGNIYDAPGRAAGTIDLAVSEVNTDDMTVLVGDRLNASDPGFSLAPLNVISPSTNIGTSLAVGRHPVFGLVGDVDADGKGDLLAGTRTNRKPLLFYADRFAAAVTGSTVTGQGIPITLQAETTATAELVVQYVGDFNGDSAVDVAVGDFRADTVATFGGQVILLY